MTILILAVANGVIGYSLPDDLLSGTGLRIIQAHTQFPGKGRTERNVVGAPAYPMFMAKTGAFFFLVFGVLAFLGTFAQINPVWLYGPYDPADVSAGTQPDFYAGFLEGAARAILITLFRSIRSSNSSRRVTVTITTSSTGPETCRPEPRSARRP